MNGSTKSSAEVAAAARKQNASLYLTEIPPSAAASRRLLENHSGIAPAEIDAHIHHIRDQAWAVFPYGFIGIFSFLDISSALADPHFQEVTARLKPPESTETFLDVGCALGTVLRHLHYTHNIPGSRLYGVNLQPRFLELGNDLFRDGGETITFLAGDMIADENDHHSLEILNGRMDIIHAAAIFHLFERDNQIKAAKRMVGFLNPGNPNVMVFGSNGGPKTDGWERYVLDRDAWRELWEEVGQATGTRWRTAMEIFQNHEDCIRSRFVVRRAV
ncbi:hypothetical protein V8F06_005425 [Rhypophila decipiens]